MITYMLAEELDKLMDERHALLKNPASLENDAKQSRWDNKALEFIRLNGRRIAQDLRSHHNEHRDDRYDGLG